VVHPQWPGDLFLEATVERRPLVIWSWVEGHAHEEAPLLTGVLVGVDDVAPGVGEKAADRGDQPGLVWAGKEQS
jgi:hypothetical protein